MGDNMELPTYVKLENVYEKTIDMYNSSIMNGEYTLDDINSLGVAYYNNGETDKASVIFCEILCSNPNFIPARVNYAHLIFDNCMKKYMDPREQIRELKRAIVYDPDCFEFWHALAITYTIVDKPQNALSVMRLALKLDPTNVDGLITMGKIYDINSMWDDAKNAYLKVLEKNPTNKYVKNEYSHVDIMSKSVGVKNIRVGYIMHINKTIYKICDGLYMGSMSAANNLVGLKQNNITHILNMAIEVPNYFESLDKTKFIYAHENLADALDSDILQNGILERCINFVSNAIESGGHVFVHCQAGISRSGAIVVAYLMKTQHIKYEDALIKTQSMRPCVYPNENFENQIKKYFKEI